MNTLVLRGVPDALYRRLKAVAASHRRSMTQEAILALEAGLAQPNRPPRPSVEDTLAWLEREVWTLPQLDRRSADEILGYGNDGLCS
jgi:antitoxin VapB